MPMLRHKIAAKHTFYKRGPLTTKLLMSACQAQRKAAAPPTLFAFLGILVP